MTAAQHCPPDDDKLQDISDHLAALHFLARPEATLEHAAHIDIAALLRVLCDETAPPYRLSAADKTRLAAAIASLYAHLAANQPKPLRHLGSVANNRRTSR